MILGNLFCLFGSVMMIIAPGNFVRSGEVAENQYGFLWRLFLRSYGECKGALEYPVPHIADSCIFPSAAEMCVPGKNRH